VLQTTNPKGAAKAEVGGKSPGRKAMSVRLRPRAPQNRSLSLSCRPTRESAVGDSQVTTGVIQLRSSLRKDTLMRTSAGTPWVLARAHIGSFTPQHFSGRKTPLSREALHILIKREFEKRQPIHRPGFGCCAVPMPFYTAPARVGDSNWQIRTKVKCARGCDSVLTGIQERLERAYDLT
jgi:hypothetical protein